MKYVFAMCLGMVIQIGVMLSDLAIIFGVLYIADQNIYLGLMVGLLAHYATSDTGGWFFAWKPSNIRDFWRNWKIIWGLI
jgi:uncharacterized membrane protein